ncbi:MAG: hypothetical protein AAB425_03970 [Bdellovibrionota bacterium]
MKKLVHSFAVVFAFSIAIECTGRTGAEIDLNFDPYLTELEGDPKDLLQAPSTRAMGAATGEWIGFLTKVCR